jgi:hypothetical protein
MSATDPDTVHDVLALRPFVPAKDYRTSFQFYTALGFEPYPLGDGLASMHLGPFAFLLQDYYVEDWANNFMMHLLVRDLDAWWARINGLNLCERFKVKAPSEPKLEPWGLAVSYVWDPSGVLWHFAQEQDRRS